MQPARRLPTVCGFRGLHECINVTFRQNFLNFSFPLRAHRIIDVSSGPGAYPLSTDGTPVVGCLQAFFEAGKTYLVFAGEHHRLSYDLIADRACAKYSQIHLDSIKLKYPPKHFQSHVGHMSLEAHALDK